MKRAFIMVLDSFGIGATEDAERFGDVGADTLGHIAEACAKGEADNGRKGPLNLPNLTRLGLAKAHEGSTGFIPAGMDGNAEVIGAYAWAHEMSSGKDTPSGHWEIAGVPVLFEWGYFSDHENSFPQELLDKLVERALLNAHLSVISISSDMENGLNRHPANPRPISSSLLQLPEAVVTTMGILFELPTLDERNSSSSSKPLISGIFRSVRSRLYSFFRISSISTETLVQVSQCIPSWAYISFNIRRSTSSLSMAITSWQI